MISPTQNPTKIKQNPTIQNPIIPTILIQTIKTKIKTRTRTKIKIKMNFVKKIQTIQNVNLMISVRKILAIQNANPTIIKPLQAVAVVALLIM